MNCVSLCAVTVGLCINWSALVTDELCINWSALVTDELCTLVCAGRLVSTGTFRALDIQLNPSDLNHFFVATDVVRCATSIFCISASSLVLVLGISALSDSAPPSVSHLLSLV